MKTKNYVVAAALLLSSLSPSVQAATSMTWNSVTVIKGDVIIPTGTSVTVAPNAKISVQKGSRITVQGTLNAPSGLSLTGKNWDGLFIIGSALITNFTESGATTPFQVGPTGTLTIHGGDISGVNGNSDVEGTLIADGIHYDKGEGAGINSNRGTGSITIDRSVLTGAGRNTGDFFGLFGAKSITLTNSQMTGSHCAFHILGVETMKLDHDSITGNSYGFMMYGSSNSGTKSIANTTIKNNNFGFDEGSASTRNGPITIMNSVIAGNGRDLGLFTGKVKILSPASK
jgi:hypothetical protein